MKRHTFKLPLEEIHSPPTFGAAVKFLFARLTCDLGSPELRDRKLVEVQCEPPVEGDSWFTVTYYTEQIRDTQCAVSCPPEPLWFPDEARPEPVPYTAAALRTRVAGLFGSAPPFQEEEPVMARPRRVRNTSFINPFDQYAVPYPESVDGIRDVPLPESCANDCEQVTQSPA